MKRTKEAAHWIGKQDGDPKPIIYLSGAARSAGITEEELQERLGYRFRCISYAFCGDTSPLRYPYSVASADFLLRTKGMRVFLDSGAHSFQEKIYRKSCGNVHNASLKLSARKAQAQAKSYRAMVDDYAMSYAEWVKTHGPFDFYVNFDYVVEAPVVYDMLHCLQGYGIRPIPVYHGDASIDWLRRYVDEGHRLVGIGWSSAAIGRPARRRYYDQVFNFGEKRGLSFHGFACTGADAFAYPWYSVDSTSWLQAAALGRLLAVHPLSTAQKPRIQTFQVSERTLHSRFLQDPDLRRRIESRGFTLEGVRGSLRERGLFNIQTYQLLSVRTVQLLQYRNRQQALA